jgi:biotin operon repressor
MSVEIRIDGSDSSGSFGSQILGPQPDRQAVLKALAGGEAMTAGQLAEATGLSRETIAPELSKLVKTGELLKADRGYKTAAPASSTTSTATANGADKSPAVLALGRELDAARRTRT